MAKKEITKVVKLQIEAGKANPSPPVGTALGPTGVNMMNFCKEFNDRTKEQQGFILPVVISIYEDRSFSFVVKKPPAAVLVKKALKLEKGSPEPNKKKVAMLTQAQLLTIAEEKMEDLNARDIEAAKKIIGGTARSMGVEVE